MKSMFGMCFNWKVLAGLAVVAAGVFVIAPNLVLGALPLLFVAICPLSMLLMMRGGHRMAAGHEHGTERPPIPATSRESLEQRLVALQEEKVRLEVELRTREQESPAGRDVQVTTGTHGRA